MDPADAVREWAGNESFANLEQIRVLIVGAGGLGCEILKNVAACGFKHIDIIDMDTIELTNLNRQFLFRQEDVGKFKAEVAAQRITSCKVTSHVCTIQEMPDAFYEEFHIVVCGLDNVEARRWINAKLVQLCYRDPSPSGLRPLIDGGSEGFKGQCRVILPGITPCYECTLSLLITEKENYPLCTIASIPRLPEHCIQWASVVKWPEVYGPTHPDFDNTEHMQWLYETALGRAASFGIDGVSLELTYGVLKRIIPAIASTNAVIAASCSLEVLKIASGKLAPIDNYFMYAGDDGIFSSVFTFEKNRHCLVCGDNTASLDIAASQPLKSLLDRISTTHSLRGQLPSASLASGAVLYIAQPESLRLQTQRNLARPLSALLPKSGEIAITHPQIPFPIRLLVTITD